MPIKNFRVQFCPQGHDTYITGRDKRRNCRICSLATSAAWAKKNPNKILSTGLKHKFNITLEDYNLMFCEQQGLCLGCLRHQSQFKKRLDVDHNHTTGKVRGLLCNGCNRGMGYIGDNPEILRRLADYLDKRGL